MEIAQDDELVILTQKSNDSEIEILTQRIGNQTSQEYKVNSSFGILSQNSEYSIPCQQSPNPPSTKESDPEILTQKSDDSIPCQQEQSYMMDSPIAGEEQCEIFRTFPPFRFHLKLILMKAKNTCFLAKISKVDYGDL